MDMEQYSGPPRAETEMLLENMESNQHGDIGSVATDEPSDGDFGSEMCLLPKILDGTYYKVLADISHSYMTKATCLTCNKQVAGSIKSTGNFYSHVDKMHPELSEICRAYSKNKQRTTADLKVLKVRRPLIKPEANVTAREIKIDRSMRRPRILDGTYYELAKKWSDGKISATCQFCNKNVSAHISHTGNLFTHIRVKHSEHIEDCRQYCSNILPMKANEIKHEKRPIEEVYIDDESTADTTKAMPDDVFADGFDSYFDEIGAAETEKRSSHIALPSTSVTQIGTNEKKMPRCERQQFSQFVNASLNQLSDRSALRAMMDIQAVLTKYRLAALGDDDSCPTK